MASGNIVAAATVGRCSSISRPIDLHQGAGLVCVRAQRLHLDAGAGALSDDRWTPPGKPEPFLHYRFCARCGILAFACGDALSLDGAFHAVPVARLDDANPDELAAAPIRYVDGRHDRFDTPPADIRLL